MSAPAAAAAPVPATTSAPAPAPASSPAGKASAVPVDGKDTKAVSPTATTTAPPAEKGPRVFVGNLAFRTTNDQLKTHMLTASANVVSAEIISYASGRSKGCGLVEFKSVADADKAIKTLTNSELDGRKIFVREDREPKGFGKKDPSAPASTAASSPPRERRAPAPAAAAAAGASADGGRGRGRGRGRGIGRGRGRGGRGRGGAGGESRDYQAPARAQNTDVTNLYVGNLAWATTDVELKQLFSDFGNVSKCVIATDRSGRSKGFATVAMQKPSDAQAAIAGLNDTEFHDRKIVVRMDHYSA